MRRITETQRRWVPPITLILFLILFVYAHEYGHYSVARSMGIASQMYFLTHSDDEANPLFWAYTVHEAPFDVTQDRKILIGGLSANLIFLLILALIGFMYAAYIDNRVLMVILIMLALGLLMLVLEWNLFRIVEGSDMYQLIYQGG